AEMHFLYSQAMQPILAREKQFIEGWIPIINYSWIEDEIEYEIEIFSYSIEPLGRENLVQFANFSMKNIGKSNKTAVLASAIRNSGMDNRTGIISKIKGSSKFSMEESSAYRDDKLLYVFKEGGEKFATPTREYKKPFKAWHYMIYPASSTAIVKYTKDLAPGEQFSTSFKMPRKPVANPKEILAIEAADYHEYRKKTIEFWNNTFESAASFSFPEKRVNESYKASLVHLILATRGCNNSPNRQGSGLPYDDLFLNDYFDMLMAYDTAGLHDFVKPNVEWLLSKQHESGMFIDVHNRGDDSIVTSHGQGVFALAHHFLFSKDKDYADKVYPSIKKGVELIIQDHLNDKYGLLRPSIPYDAPMVTGYHTCHNLFALTALQTSIKMAQMLGYEEDANYWIKTHSSYKQAILKAIDNAYERSGYVTSGLYDWKAGYIQGRTSLGKNDFPNQDWENNLLLYPTELLKADDPRLVDTVETIRKRKYSEGVMTYRNGMHIHQYATLNQAQQYLGMGNQYQALLDFYHVLLHNGPTHEGFENLVEPWTRTVDPSCPPPHAWAAAKIALFIRNMAVCEYGGEGGINSKERIIKIFSIISPEWATAGKVIEVKNARVEQGRISANLTFTDSGATITIDSNFDQPVKNIAMKIPYFVKLNKVKSDTADHFESDGYLYFNPTTREIQIDWEIDQSFNQNTIQKILINYRSEYGFTPDVKDYEQPAPSPFLSDEEKQISPQPLSFEAVRKAFLIEYNRRLKIFEKNNVKLKPVKAPPFK
ncbi:MAG: hypothetical protein JXR63_06795, partial [Spirochaetales bacterium]|nr:hypothetical protein [Spirochaetales bacterium]